MQYKIQSTPKKIPFILCQIGVAVLRSKIPNRQVFPQNKIHRKFILKNLIPNSEEKTHSKIIRKILCPKL
jgi:hypothetical protein